eukprot:1647605-Pyramimonas_sp.AAC.1
MDDSLLFVGNQEARGREGQQWADGYLALRAGADAGGHGCALPVATTIPYVIGKRSYYRTERHLRIIHKTPTRLLVRADAPHLSICSLVAHAPLRGRTAEERKTWWQDTVELLDI